MPIILKIDEFIFHHNLQDTTGPALVFFTGIHCGSCHHLRRVLEKMLEEHLDITVFEVDAGISPSLVNEYAIFHLPSMLLFNNGNFHCYLHSEPLPQKIYAAIQAALQHPPEEEP
ncbi:MAG: Thioredoxin [uncultured Thiotrichaceae bacterium]|uniref:Thioredoxin n=1 Tax=uncultured Thiotrichaceae bacterium TaxID=298394 RepID=A0A6S6SR58_9GAMM|nr:MAG: Thioredoxin [uncultured Thiotrichaceae bacterium]